MSQDTANILVFPPAASVVAPALAGFMEWLVPLGILPAPGGAFLITGIILMALAGVLAVTGTHAFKRAKTNIDPRRPALVLVSDGPYQFTRNPMYLGMITLNLGLTLAASLDWGLLTTPILALILHYGVVLREESYLLGKFGDPYAALLKRTRRWL